MTRRTRTRILIELIFILSVLSPTLNNVDGTEYFTVTRNDRVKFDIFKVPSGLRTSSLPCSSYGGVWHEFNKFLCQCTFESGTFSFHQGKRACIRNRIIRQLSDCGHTLDYEHHMDSPIAVLSSELGLAYSLRLPSDTCRIDHPSSRYLDCNGNWISLQLEQDNKPFELTLNGSGVTFPFGVTLYKYKLKVHNTLPMRLRGRTFRLSTTCKATQRRPCLTVKTKGEISCPVTPISPSTTSTTPTSSVSSVSPEHITTGNGFSISTNTPTKNLSMIVKTGAPNRGNQEDQGTSSGLIAGLTVLFLLLALVVVLAGYAYRKRRRGEEVQILTYMNPAAVYNRFIAFTKPQQNDKEKREDTGNPGQTGKYNYAFDGPQVNQPSGDPIYEEVENLDVLRSAASSDDNESNHPSDWSDWSDDFSEDGRLEVVVHASQVDNGKLHGEHEEGELEARIYDEPPDSDLDTIEGYAKGAKEDVIAQSSPHFHYESTDNPEEDENVEYYEAGESVIANELPRYYHVTEKETAPVSKPPLSPKPNINKDSNTGKSSSTAEPSNEPESENPQQQLHYYHVLENRREQENVVTKPPVSPKPVITKVSSDGQTNSSAKGRPSLNGNEVGNEEPKKQTLNRNPRTLSNKRPAPKPPRINK